MALKTCTDCGETKDETEFTLRTRGDRKSQCKPCIAVRSVSRRAVPKHKRSAFLSRMRRFYGLSEADWDDLVISHTGRCAICNDNPEILHVDHCHELGHVRGLLCYPCNSMIGLAKDNVNTLANAIDYLKENS